MPAALVEALALAGMAHDWGKADPRFQAILHGSRIKALQRRTLLAKSVALSEPAYQMARANSGYPEGARHELLSVRLLETLPSPPPEPDLVRHLVAAHHGRCRAFAPVVADTDPVRVTMAHEGHALTASSATGLDALSSGVAERFWNLTAQYGWWGLAFLEALLRLADHRASEYPDMEVPA
jgi:CRISPR-associated endonuclease/helicase Cas3